MQYRQGHILLHPQPKPKNAVPVVPARPNHVVLATGETGREHVFKSNRVNIYQAEGNLFIEVLGEEDDPVYLEHPEHGDIPIEPGTYRLVEQREANDADIGFGGSTPRRSYD